MTTILEKTMKYLAPDDCMICGKEGNTLCASCSYLLKVDFANHCFYCASRVIAYQLCANCRKKAPAMNAIYVLADYADERVRLIIKALKYGGKRQIAEDIAVALGSILPSFKSSFTITYAPTTRQRERQRGYDQAEKIARAVALQQKVAFERLLVRKSALHQVGSTKEQRQQNAQNMFIVRANKRLPQTAVIVDDVLTTGATLEAAARLLKEAGVRTVYGLALARATLKS